MYPLFFSFQEKLQMHPRLWFTLCTSTCCMCIQSKHCANHSPSCILPWVLAPPSLQERDQRLHRIISALEMVEAAEEGTGWADLQQPISTQLGGIGEALRLPSTPTASATATRRRGQEAARPPISRPKFAPPRKPPAAAPPAVAQAPPQPPLPPKDSYVEGELLQVSSSVASRAHQVLQRLEETVNEAAAVLGVLGAEAGAAAAAAAPRGSVMEQLDSTVGELAAALHVEGDVKGSARVLDAPLEAAAAAAAVVDAPVAPGVREDVSTETGEDEQPTQPDESRDDAGEDEGRDGGSAAPRSPARGTAMDMQP